MVDNRFRDQASELRHKMDEINNADHLKIEQEGLNTNREDLNVLNLPPRSQVHANKKTKTKWKLSFPLVRLLVVLFILIVGLMLTFNFWGKEFLTTNVIHPKNNSNSAGELVTIISGKNAEQKDLQEESGKQQLISTTPLEPEDAEAYEVKVGDTLESISIEFYGNKESKSIIIEKNRLINEELEVGQVLVLPNKEEKEGVE
ncbi:LysM peptidoglycan-binding domain-containing protein [Aquibacillus koreensis]|uniref:LysM peptidoglycan-binding domain-containing protein n=1 Tax=Aquibacillus koreensis TaxID=279446 RepID=A0A9X3WKN7_9BACI|nr:LysM peptidoglycan-binding domain-containing protein [Aquibacillus koreensis]MCT2537415.1 LysM peptidoglycan-binding domain-containing protein [Aquibacillus koreensis]MDC3418861.1 LysM peptidoglycan-binding domain-containing protein [Aquibacillus koreensis]